MLAIAIAATLVSALPTTDGLMVCADRRAQIPGKEERVENYRKVFPAASNAVFAVNGLSMMTHAGILVFDMRTTVSKLIEKSGLPKNRDEYHVLMQGIINEFGNSGAAKMVTTMPRVPGMAADGPLVEVTFYSVEDGKPVINAVAIFFTPGVSSQPDIRMRTVTLDRWFSGTVDIAKEMSFGHDPRFDDLHRDYQRLWGEGRKPAPRTALEFSRHLIREASKRSELLTSRPSDIGEKSDCAAVTNTSVKWFLAGSTKN